MPFFLIEHSAQQQNTQLSTVTENACSVKCKPGYFDTSGLNRVLYILCSENNETNATSLRSEAECQEKSCGPLKMDAKVVGTATESDDSYYESELPYCTEDVELSAISNPKCKVTCAAGYEAGGNADYFYNCPTSAEPGVSSFSMILQFLWCFA